MPDSETIEPPFRPFARAAWLVGLACLALTGCDTALQPLVGKSKATTDREAAAAIPPAPPASTASFLHSDRLSGLYADTAMLPPTLPMDDTDQGAGSESSQATVSHKPIASVPLSANAAAMSPLAAAAKPVAANPNIQFVLLVLTPPAADTGTMDRNSALAKLAVVAAVKTLSDEGVAPDRVEVSMATNPTVGAGEMRLYRR